MAAGGEDDLDAFFEDVSQVEAKAKDDEEEDERNIKGENKDEHDDDDLSPQPPQKKKKLPSEPLHGVIPPHRRGVAVAVAAASISTSAVPAAARILPAATAPTGSANGHYHDHPLSAPAVPPPPPPPPLPPLPPPPLPSHAPRPPPHHLAAFHSSSPQSVAAPQPPDASHNHHHDDDDNDISWPATGLRLFVGNLGNEVGDAELLSHFSSRYPSCQKARVIRDVRNKGASKGFGFVWFAEPIEGARAKREMDQTWLQSRPIRIKKYHHPGSSDQKHQQQGQNKTVLARAQQSGRRNRR